MDGVRLAGVFVQLGQKKKELVTGRMPEGMDPTLRQAGPLASPDYSKAVKALVRRESCAMWLEWLEWLEWLLYLALINIGGQK